VQGEAFVLFAHNELSLEEVAQITQVGVETAKSRLRYARTTLRQRLLGWSLCHA
jgi:RNA polymerase sigma-70 factor (ECF subfamily)